MSDSDLIKSALLSRVERVAAAGNDGVREIAGYDPSQNQQGGIVGTIFNFLGGGLKFAGWLVAGALGFLSFSFSSLFGLFVSAITFIDNFDWNASDAQLDMGLETAWSQFGGILGGAVGNTLGWLLCGLGTASGIFLFNEPLGLYLLKEVGEEAFDEILASMRNVLYYSFRLATRAFFVGAYKNLRKLAKKILLDPDSDISAMLKGILGLSDDAIKSWGSGKQPWILSQKRENAIESIKSPFWENFVEEGLEEFSDACIESGYVIAGGLDSWFAAQKLTQNTLLGQERAIEITPNRAAENERIVLVGKENLLRDAIPVALAQYQMVENRDVGQIMGEPMRDYIRKTPSTLSLKIQLFSVPEPPWVTAEGKAPRRVQITIPDLDRTKVDWASIKLAVGGSNGYMWGRFRAVAKLSNGSNMVVYAGSSSEAKDRLQALLLLSNATIVTLTVSEEQKEGARLQYKALYKENTQVYPGYVTILNRQKVLNEDSGVATLSGVYKNRRGRLELWTKEKPEDWDTQVQELLRVQGANSP